MRKLLLLLFPFSLWAQSYFEATGQTYAFTWVAGNKTGWNAAMTEAYKNQQPSNDIRMMLSPNPASGPFQILLSSRSSAAMATIYNITGKKIENIVLNGRQNAMFTHTLPNGVYFVRLHVSGRLIQTSRLLVVR